MNYRADVVGSMLRPEYLLQGRDQYAAGKLTEGQMRDLEDRAVDECIAIQERAHIDVLTDGEMRRNVFASQLAQACDGFGTVKNNEVDWFTLDGKLQRSPVTMGLVSKIRRKRQ